MWPWDAHLGHNMRFTLRSIAVEGVLTNYWMRGDGLTLNVIVAVEGNPNEVNIPWSAVEFWEDLDTGTTNPADIQPSGG